MKRSTLMITGLRLRTRLAASASLAVLVAACGAPAWKPPVSLSAVDLSARAQTLSEDGLIVTVAVPSREETEQLFGTSLYRDRIQPVWVEIDNQTPHTWVLLKPGMDGDYFSPLEASFQRHSGSKEVRFEMDRHFDAMGFEGPVVPDAVTAGFVFTNLDEGAKAINVDLVSDHGMLNFSFVVLVPGLVTDVDRVDLDTLYDEWIEIDDEDELRRLLAELPCCTANKKGSAWGDPLNVVFVGHRHEIFSALIRRDWHQTEVTHARSAWKTFKSFLFGARYRYSPISSLYVFDRPQDVGLQRARDTIHLRNHMRLWRTPYVYRGDEVYIGQISRDVGVKFNRRTITTHAIDPDVDETRDGLIADLAYSQSLRAFGYVEGSQVSTLDEPHFNLTPDPYYSDGLRVVLFFGERPTALDEIEILDWERTGAMRRAKLGSGED